MGICYLCEKEDRSWNAYYCSECNRIKRLIHLYGLKRVSEILTCVLIRTNDQQQHKIKVELEKEKNVIEESHKETSELIKKVLRSGKELKQI